MRHYNSSSFSTHQLCPDPTDNSHTAVITASSDSLQTASSHPHALLRSQDLLRVKPLHLMPSTCDLLSSTEATPDAKLEFVDSHLVQHSMPEHVENQNGANITAQMIGYDHPNVKCFVDTHIQVERWRFFKKGGDGDKDGPNVRCRGFV